MKMVNRLKEHVLYTTALIAESAPVFATLEVGAAGFSDAASFNARVGAATLGYLGLAYLYKKGRSVFRKHLNITEKTTEKIQTGYDSLYGFCFNMIFSPPLYAASQALAGEDLDFIKIGTGTLLSSIFGAINGIPAGYALDWSGDLFGLKECERPSYPKFIKRQSPRIKKAIAAGLIAASVGVIGLIYSLTPDKDVPPQESKIEYHELPHEKTMMLYRDD